MKITSVGELVPGTVFLEVEAYSDGGFFQVGEPLLVVKDPPYKAIEWPRGSKWSVWVRKLGDKDKPQNTFAVSIPSNDGVRIERKPGDRSAFFLYTSDIEQKLRSLKSMKEYNEFSEA